MVKNRLAQNDAQSNGWLLDGYPRSASQGAALEAAGIHPELFLLLEARFLTNGLARPRRAWSLTPCPRCLTRCWLSALWGAASTP
jgi:hypothetical protein